MPTEDKRRGKNLPSPVTPPTTTCFRIRIPNAVEYKAALFGVLGQLAEWYTWDHPLNGTDCLDCEEAAQLWAKALAEATFEEECDETMSCADVADCIENDASTRTVIQQIISSQSTPGGLATPGQAMTTAQANTPLNPAPPDCDPDVLWAQCEQLTDYMVDAARDTLEYIETYSNALEGAQFIELAPFLGTIIDEAQIDKALDFINWIQENVKEYFEAADTTPNRQAIACSIFCACKDDCEITIDRIWGTINERLGGILNPGDIDSLDDFIDAALTLIGSETIALDAALVVITGFAKFAGYLGVKGIDKTLNLVLKVAMNDANDDWILLCEECAEETWCHTQDLTTDITNLVLVYTEAGAPYQSVFTSGVGIEGARPGFEDENIPKYQLPAPARITSISFTFDVSGSPVNVYAFMFPNGDTSWTPQAATAGPNAPVFMIDEDLDFIQFGIDRAGLDRTPIAALTSVTINGTGTNPFGTSNC